jgi:hypothetical protein
MNRYRFWCEWGGHTQRPRASIGNKASLPGTTEPAGITRHDTTWLCPRIRSTFIVVNGLGLGKPRLHPQYTNNFINNTPTIRDETPTLHRPNGTRVFPTYRQQQNLCHSRNRSVTCLR